MKKFKVWVCFINLLTGKFRPFYLFNGKDLLWIYLVDEKSILLVFVFYDLASLLKVSSMWIQHIEQRDLIIKK